MRILRKKKRCTLNTETLGSSITFLPQPNLFEHHKINCLCKRHWACITWNRPCGCSPTAHKEHASQNGVAVDAPGHRPPSSVAARGGSTSYRGRYEVGWACHISAQDRLKMRFSGRTKRFRVRTKSQSAVQHIIHVTRYSLRLSRPVRPHSDSTRTRAARTRQSQCAKRTEPESAAHLAGLVIGLSPSRPARFGGLRLASGPVSSADGRGHMHIALVRV